MVKGWPIVDRNDQFNEGDLAIYVPIDAVIRVPVQTNTIILPDVLYDVLR